MAVDRSSFKFGAMPSPAGPHLQLAKYVDLSELPPIPKENAWGDGVLWTMMLNDEIGSCTVAGAGHKIQMDAFINHGKEITPSDEEIRDVYFFLTGGVDSGLPLETVLRFWRKTGISGQKIGAYAQVDVSNLSLVKAAMYLCGGLYVGMVVHDFAMKQVVWDYKGQRETNPGGHCVLLTDYHKWGLMCSTWGMDQPMTYKFFQRYFFEAWAVISEEWVEGGDTPHGFKTKDLLKDLKALS